MTRLLTLSLLALVAVLFAAPVAQAQYDITQSLGNDTFGSKSTGQTFTPNVGINPDPGAVTELDLTQITLYHGNYTANAPSATTYLVIYDGDPNAGGNVIGASSNYIDTTTGLYFHSAMVWTFNNVTLNYVTEYWAVMESSDTGGLLDVAVSLETHDRNLGDVYTGGTGLIANQAPHSSSVDAKFEILLEDPPGAYALAISPDPLLAGQSGTFTVTNGTPLANTYLAYSLVGPGSTWVPALNATLGLASPLRAAGPTPTNASGTVSWTLPIPAAGVGLSVWLQAVEYGQVTNVIATSIQ